MRQERWAERAEAMHREVIMGNAPCYLQPVTNPNPSPALALALALTLTITLTLTLALAAPYP